MSWKFLSRATKQTSKKILNLSLATIIGVSGVFTAVPFLFPAHAYASGATFYVNAAWLGITPGTDPDGAGPAANFGTDSFSTIQAAVNAATAGNVIQISGTYGSASAYTRYDVPVEKTGITLQGMTGNLVYGTFVVQADGVTITGMNIQHKGDLTGSSFNRGGIYARVNSITITGNTITNGLGTSAGIANGMQIMRASDVINTNAADYTITGNTISGTQAVYPGASSAGILVTQNFSSGVAGGAGYSILVNDNQIATQNTFNITTPDVIDYVHQDWHNFVGPDAGKWSYSRVSNSAGLSEAVLNSAAGATILVAAGTYDNQLVITKSLTIKGAGDTTIIRPSASSTLSSTYTYPAGTFWPGTVMGGIVLVKDSANVTIKDLKIDGINVTSVPTGASRVAGILYGESGGTIDNVTVTTMVVDGYATRSYGIDLSAVGTARNVEVKNSDIINWSRNGIQAQGASLTADIHNNTLVGAGNVGVAAAVPNGILFIHGVNGNATNNKISAMHTTASDSRSAGILFFDPVTAGIVVENNNIFDVDDGVLVGHNANDVIIRNNNLHNNTKGIQLEDGATNNSITGNTITDNTYGIFLDTAADAGTGNTASNNSITGSVTLGVNNLSANGFVATNNWWGSAVLATVQSKVNDIAKVNVTPYYVNSGKTILSNVAPSIVYIDPAYTDGSAGGHIFGYDAFTTVQAGANAVAPGGTVSVVAQVTGGQTTLTGSTSSGNVTVTIPAGTTVTASGDGTWDGVINPPTVTTIVIPDTPGFMNTIGLVFSVGSDSVTLTFNQGVRLVLPDQAGKHVGFIVPGGSFTEITSVCSDDTQTVGNALTPISGACKIDVGDNLVIWTKHFTKFATYSQTSNPVQAPTSSGGGSSSSSPAATPQPNKQTYTVVSGDTLFGIGTTFGVDWHLIASLNGINAPYTIYPGQVLGLPGGNVVTAPASGPAAQSTGVETGVGVLGESSNAQIATVKESPAAAVAAAPAVEKAGNLKRYWYVAIVALAMVTGVYYVYQAKSKKNK